MLIKKISLLSKGISLYRKEIRTYDDVVICQLAGAMAWSELYIYVGVSV